LISFRKSIEPRRQASRDYYTWQ